MRVAVGRGAPPRPSRSGDGRSGRGRAVTAASGRAGPASEALRALSAVQNVCFWGRTAQGHPVVGAQGSPSSAGRTGPSAGPRATWLSEGSVSRGVAMPASVRAALPSSAEWDVWVTLSPLRRDARVAAVWRQHCPGWAGPLGFRPRGPAP